MVDQKSYYDDQTYDLDILDIYNKFIQQIDNMRSHIRVSDVALPKDSNISSQDDITNLTNLIAATKAEDKAQESRCHAFYRLVGFPVVDKDGNMYSPGFDLDNNANATVLSNKLKIFHNINEDLIKLVNKRENIQQSYLKLFDLQDITSSGLGLSSLDVRKFSAPIINTDPQNPFDTDISKQSYTLSNKDIKSKIFAMVDVNSNHPQPSAISSQRNHILKPIMVDTRIELSVNPQKNMVCAPFVLDKTKTKLSGDVFLKRPLLEKVCRDRFDTSNAQDPLGDYTNNIIDYVKNNNSIKDDELLKKIFSTNTNFKDENRFARFFNIIRSMIAKLVESINIVALVRTKYNYIPIPDKNGPEFGNTTMPIVRADPGNSYIDNILSDLIVKQNITNIVEKIQANSKVDIGGYAFDEVILVPDDPIDNSKKITDNIESMTNERNENCEKANDALKIIEIIMGEFSGFGLCDIIAFYTALYTVDKNVLVCLLDENSFARLKNIPELRCSEVETRIAVNPKLYNGKDALKLFENQLRQIYVLMDELFRSEIEDNSSKK